MNWNRQGLGLTLGIVIWLACGCSSTPPGRSHQAASHVEPPGYVDFFLDSDDDVSWFVAVADSAEGPFHKVFYQIQPIEGRTLRLTRRPGRKVFKVTFLNRVVLDAPAIPIEVQSGRVTPVAIRLAVVGEAQVQTRKVIATATVQGGFKTRSLAYGPEQAYRLTGVPGEPVVPQPVEFMPYAQGNGK